MQTNEIQELLLDTIPAWHYWFARPFKRMLNDGVSLDMYYCIQSMRRSGHTMTMTELANFARMPKQQMSKLVDRLVDGGFAERLSDRTTAGLSVCAPRRRRTNTSPPSLKRTRRSTANSSSSSIRRNLIRSVRRCAPFTIRLTSSASA